MTVKKSRCNTLQNTSIENNSVKETKIKQVNPLFIANINAAFCKVYGSNTTKDVILQLTLWLFFGSKKEIYKSARELSKELNITQRQVEKIFSKIKNQLNFVPFLKMTLRNNKNFKLSFFSLDKKQLKKFVEDGGTSELEDGDTSELEDGGTSELEDGGTSELEDGGINNKVYNKVNSERKDSLSIPSFKDFVEKNPSVKTNPNCQSAKPVFEKLSDTEKIESVKEGDGYQIYLDRCLESKCKPEQPTWYLKNKLWQGNPPINNNPQMTTSDAARILKNQASSSEETKIALVTRFQLLQNSTIDFEASTVYIKAYSLYSKRKIQDFIPEIEKVSQRKVVLYEQTISYS